MMPGVWKACGSIGRANAWSFNADLHDAIDNSTETLVRVDCAAATFEDSTAYRALVDATTYATRRGYTLVIRNMSPSCQALMRLYDFDRELRFEV
jgi:anti-anti-sigma regulatory factor